MSSRRITSLILMLILLVSTSSTLFANLSIDQTENNTLSPRVSGLILPRVDGYIDKNAPTGYASEWADAHSESIVLKNQEGVELPAVQMEIKVVMDRILIGLLLPAVQSASFEEVKVIYDANSDGKLSDGDARLSYQFASGLTSVEVYSPDGFVPLVSAPNLNLDQQQARYYNAELVSAAAHSFDGSLNVETSFSFGDYSKLTGNTITIVGRNFGKSAFSVLLMVNDVSSKSVIPYGYPSIPIGTGQNTIDYTVDTFYDTYFVQTPFVPTLLTGDVGVNNIEVTQTVQTYNNELPLVKNKPTMARVYVNNPSGSPLGVEVHLTGYYEDAGGGLVNKGTMTLSFTAPTSVDRTVLTDTANFLLPAIWTNHADTQTLRLKAEVSAAFIDRNPTDNTFLTNVRFQKTHDLNIYYLQVNEGSAASPSLISDIDPNFIPQAKDEFRAYYPDANPRFIELDWESIGVFSGTSDQLKNKLNDLAATITLAALFAILFGVDPADVPFPDQVFGFRTSGAGSSTPSWGGFTTHYGAWGGLNAKRGPGVLAHETNHNIGDENWGRHVPGCTAAGADPLWPSTTDQTIDQIYPGSSSGTIGWHYIIDQLTVNNFDFMSYCMGGDYVFSGGTDTSPGDPDYPISWTSDYRWIRLFNDLSTFSPGNPQPRYTQNLELNSLINQMHTLNAQGLNLDFTLPTTRVISGSVLQDGNAMFKPSYTVFGNVQTLLPAVKTATHYVEIQYVNDPTLQIPIQATFDDSFDAGVHDPTTEVGFSFWIPDNGTISKITLTDAKGNILDTLSGTGYSDLKSYLTVPQSYTRGENINLSFNLDMDNKTRLYTQLQYSPNGTIWYDIGPQKMGTIDPFSVDLLPGGTETQFRVRVTDGFDTYYLAGSNPLLISDLPPTVEILSKKYDLNAKDPLKLVLGSTLSLRAEGQDPETGAIKDPKAYYWKLLDQAGNLVDQRDGQDYNFPIFKPGSYSLTLTVYDPAQNSASQTIPIEIVSLNFASQSDVDQFIKAINEVFDGTTTSIAPTDNQGGDKSDTPGFNLSLPLNAILLALTVVVLVPNLRRRKNKY